MRILKMYNDESMFNYISTFTWFSVIYFASHLYCTLSPIFIYFFLLEQLIFFISRDETHKYYEILVNWASLFRKHYGKIVIFLNVNSMTSLSELSDNEIFFFFVNNKMNWRLENIFFFFPTLIDNYCNNN